MAREDNEDRIRRREIRERQEARGAGAVATGEQGAGGGVIPFQNRNFNYSTNLGMYSDPRYQYQVGDEFSSPGEMPDPVTQPEEYAQWRRHAGAWRRFIGQRQQYVNSMIGTGFSPEDLGIFNRKEEGQAGYRRLTAPGVMEGLRANSEQYMRGTDARIDPVTGFYMMGSGPTAQYFDARGMGINRQGQRTGGFYGMQNTAAQYGARAIPRMGMNSNWQVARPVGGRMHEETPRLPEAPAMLLPNRANQFNRYAPRSRRNRQTVYGV